MSASIIPCEVSKLVKSFGRNAVLRGLSLSLQAREITGLIGVNGAGKTTLFRILCGLDGADGGAGSLIEATRRLLGNKLERQSLRTAARQEAERWGWAGATEQLRGYYRQVLNQPALTAA